MNPMLIAMTIAATSAGAQDTIVVEPDYGLTLVAPAGFGATLEGIDPASNSRLIGVKTTDPDLAAIDPSANFCEIAFYYDATYGAFPQDQINAFFLDTNHFETMREEVEVPGTITDSVHFTHRGSAGHHFLGDIDTGGSFVVSVIVSTQGFTLVSCVTANPDLDPASLQPILDGLVTPGQSGESLVVSGDCRASLPDLPQTVDESQYVDTDGALIRALDAERERIASQCDPLHAESMMDAAIAGVGFEGSYRDFREHTLSRAVFHQLSEDDLAELESAYEEMEELSGTQTADRWMRHTLFIIGRDHLLD